MKFWGARSGPTPPSASVNLLDPKNQNSFLNFQGGGALISKKHILTVAHSFYPNYALWGAKWAKSPVIGKIWISFICHARVVNLLIIISTQCFGMYLSNWKAKIHVYLHDKIAYFQFFQKNLNFILEDNCFVRGWTSQLRPVAGDNSSIASIQHPIGLN